MSALGPSPGSAAAELVRSCSFPPSHAAKQTIMRHKAQLRHPRERQGALFLGCVGINLRETKAPPSPPSHPPPTHPPASWSGWSSCGCRAHRRSRQRPPLHTLQAVNLPEVQGPRELVARLALAVQRATVSSRQLRNADCTALPELCQAHPPESMATGMCCGGEGSGRLGEVGCSGAPAAASSAARAASASAARSCAPSSASRTCARAHQCRVSPQCAAAWFVGWLKGIDWEYAPAHHATRLYCAARQQQARLNSRPQQQPYTPAPAACARSRPPGAAPPRRRAVSQPSRPRPPPGRTAGSRRREHSRANRAFYLLGCRRKRAGRKGAWREKGWWGNCVTHALPTALLLTASEAGPRPRLACRLSRSAASAL